MWGLNISSLIAKNQLQVSGADEEIMGLLGADMKEVEEPGGNLQPLTSIVTEWHTSKLHWFVVCLSWCSPLRLSAALGEWTVKVLHAGLAKYKSTFLKVRCLFHLSCGMNSVKKLFHGFYLQVYVLFESHFAHIWSSSSESNKAYKLREIKFDSVDMMENL